MKTSYTSTDGIKFQYRQLTEADEKILENEKSTPEQVKQVLDRTLFTLSNVEAKKYQDKYKEVIGDIPKEDGFFLISVNVADNMVGIVNYRIGDEHFQLRFK